MTCETRLATAKARLVEAEKLLGQKISSYPTPIAGRDQQFNHLLEERQSVSLALAALSVSVHPPTPRQLDPVE